MDYVQRHYSVPIHNHHHKKGRHHGPAAQAQAPNWLVYYPSALEEESLPGGTGLGNGAVEVREQPMSAQQPFSAGAAASNTTSPSSSNNNDTSESTSVQEKEEEEGENEQNDKDNNNDKDKFSGGPNDNDDNKNMTQQPEPDHQQTSWVPSSVVVFFIKVSEEE